MSDGGAWSVRKLVRLHEAVKTRLQSGGSLYCRHLSINLVALDLIIQQGLDILVQEVLHSLQPDELVYLGDSFNPPNIKTIHTYGQLRVMKLLVFVDTGEELGFLAILLQACAATLTDLELVFSEDLHSTARLSYPAPRCGFAISELPKLERCYLTNRWQQKHRFKRGEVVTLRNLADAMPPACCCEVVEDACDWSVLPTVPRPWPSRFQVLKSRR